MAMTNKVTVEQNLFVELLTELSWETLSFVLFEREWLAVTLDDRWDL